MVEYGRSNVQQTDTRKYYINKGQKGGNNGTRSRIDDGTKIVKGHYHSGTEAA